MADEQDRAEALDEDKGAFPADQDPGVDLLDQTADADPDATGPAAALFEEGETGDEGDGVLGERDRSSDPYHQEEPAPEVAAVHVVDEP